MITREKNEYDYHYLARNQMDHTRITITFLTGLFRIDTLPFKLQKDMKNN